MRTTADHAGDRPEDWEAPSAALVTQRDHTHQQAVALTPQDTLIHRP
jgi:hypothetical protein